MNNNTCRNCGAVNSYEEKKECLEELELNAVIVRMR